MAKLNVDLDDFHEGNLPPSCICCGGPSCVSVERRFLPTPTWLLVLNYLPLGNIWLSSRDTRGKVPLCRKHKRRLTLGRKLRIVGFALIALVILSAILAIALGGPTAAPLLFLAVLCLVPLVVLLGPCAFYVDLTTPRVSSLDSSTVTLDSVSPKFAKQVVDQSPEGLPTTAERLPSSESLPAILLGLSLTFLFLPTAVAFGAWGLSHFNREPQLAQNRPAEPPAGPAAKPNTRSLAQNSERQNSERQTDARGEAVAEPDAALPSPVSGTAPASASGPASSPQYDPVMGTLLPATPDRATPAMSATPAPPDDSTNSDSSSAPADSATPDDSANANEPPASTPAPNSPSTPASVAEAIDALLRSETSTAKASLLAWLQDQDIAPEDQSAVLARINARNPNIQDAANELVELLQIPTAAIIEQCLADLEDSSIDNRQVARRLAACEVEADSRVALGRALAKAITARGVELDPLVETFKQCAGHEHVPEIIELLSEKQSGKVLDAGRAVAIHLRDPDVYPAVVRLIDVPFGDRRTAEVCREIGPAIEQALWPYLTNPRRARLAAEILRDIGTPESIRPLLAAANRTTDQSLQRVCGEAVTTIRQQGKARARALAAAEAQRLAATEAATGEHPTGRSTAGGPAANDTAAEPAATKLRTWTDRTGRFKRQGELVSVTETTASIRIAGKVVQIPIAQLSEADQQFLAGQR
ncbi:SHD1 domain-containing protein [Roseimaritima ulvae]|uniref:SLA1 homology domain-containing protein n=1 Tax=Roseimaritima ulvae TaxID=980254 RepID=A0A5B9QZE6_9BACT|nr:SHD1 domain-containing protein [Roseimaritima ulvae]QEG43349.1 hypothetical protein UC8_53960 [Roseimaritima ulvae]